MKIFTINKVGYTAGIYGCSGEYFNCVIINSGTKEGREVVGFTFHGMYGAEERVGAKLKERGFEDRYLPMNTYGKLTRKDILKVYSEHVAIENIDELIEHGYIELKK